MAATLQEILIQDAKLLNDTHQIQLDINNVAQKVKDAYENDILDEKFITDNEVRCFHVHQSGIFNDIIKYNDIDGMRFLLQKFPQEATIRYSEFDLKKYTVPNKNALFDALNPEYADCVIYFITAMDPYPWSALRRAGVTSRKIVELGIPSSTLDDLLEEARFSDASGLVQSLSSFEPGEVALFNEFLKDDLRARILPEEVVAKMMEMAKLEQSEILGVNFQN